MSIDEQIKKYIASQPDPKRSDMQALHRVILQVMPLCKIMVLGWCKNSESAKSFLILTSDTAFRR